MIMRSNGDGYSAINQGLAILSQVVQLLEGSGVELFRTRRSCADTSVVRRQSISRHVSHRLDMNMGFIVS